MRIDKPFSVKQHHYTNRKNERPKETAHFFQGKVYCSQFWMRPKGTVYKETCQYKKELYSNITIRERIDSRTMYGTQETNKHKSHGIYSHISIT